MNVVNLDRVTEEQIRRCGRKYKAAVLPSDLPRGRVGLCFDWCALLAVNNVRYKYVEGLASDPDNPKHWIAHAWLTDGEHAFDPTWKCTRDTDSKELPVPSKYIGVEIPTEKVVAFMRLTGYQGVFVNRFRAPAIVEDILGVYA